MIYNTLIIGGGISGIMTLKQLIDEGEKNIIVLNKNKEPFGVWDVNNHPSVLNSTYSVSSKLYMTISDFPINESYPEFPHASIILQYYKDYATHFDLYKYIHNDVEIIKCTKINNIWNITTSDNKIYYAKNLVVATGAINSCLNYPDEPFFKNFTGTTFHSDNYKQYQDKLKDKKILIIGGSDSSCDIAVELGRNRLNKVYLSMKNGRWFQPRSTGANIAADSFYSRILDFYIKNITGKKYINEMFGQTFIELAYGPTGSGVKEWKAKCDYLNDYYIKSRDIINSISIGEVFPRSYVENIKKNEIKFINKEGYENFDIIIYATGYKTNDCFYFLDKKYDKRYKFIYSPEEPNIFFVGFIRPYLTSIPMLVELQSRWVAKVITNKVKLPNKNDMIKEIEYDMEKQKKEFPCSYKRLPIVDPYDYSDMIASKIGAKPDLIKLYFTNRPLWEKIMYDSWTHHIYRLNDPDPKKVKIAIDNIEKNHNTQISYKIRQVKRTLFITTKKVIINIILKIFIITVILIELINYIKYKYNK
jgi:thioredoxin reductase